MFRIVPWRLHSRNSDGGNLIFMTTYSEKLKSPKWQKKRLEILQRDEFMCTYCEDAESELHVHHKKYIYGNEVWDYENENFITLCKPCHEEITQKKKSIKELIDNSFIYTDDLDQLMGIITTISGCNSCSMMKAHIEIKKYFEKERKGQNIRIKKLIKKYKNLNDNIPW